MRRGAGEAAGATVAGMWKVLPLLLLLGCASYPLPVGEGPLPDAPLILAWEGHGNAFIFWKGEWRRYAVQDYDYVVVQRRYADRWASRKDMHRRHPKHRGARDDQLYFEVAFGPAGESVPMTITSSMGEGTGTIDPELRVADVVLVDKGPMWNRVRFHQEFLYGEGRLVETVELYTERPDGTETPFLRIEEEAILLAPTTFAQAPEPLPK